MPFYTVSKTDIVITGSCADEESAQRETLQNIGGLSEECVRGLAAQAVTGMWRRLNAKGFRLKWSDGFQTKGKKFNSLTAGQG